MTNEVIWTKIVLERFIEQANLSEDEEIVIRTRAAGWSRIKQAMELNLSVSTIDRIISRLKRKYDEVQASDPILPPRTATWSLQVNNVIVRRQLIFRLTAVFFFIIITRKEKSHVRILSAAIRRTAYSGNRT